MKVSPQFLLAKKDKGLTHFVLHQITNPADGTKRNYMRLCLEIRNKYSDSRQSVDVETDTDIRVENYYNATTEPSGCPTEKIKMISFCELTYGDSHIKTFLKAIRKDSDVRFNVVAFNSSDFSRRIGIVHHTLYGYIGEDKYRLCDYSGADNSASPINY